MSFIPNKPKEKNNYAKAIKTALDTLKNTTDWYTIKDADLDRKTAHSAQSVFQGLEKLVKAGKLQIEVAKGVDPDHSDATVVAIRRLTMPEAPKTS